MMRASVFGPLLLGGREPGGRAARFSRTGVAMPPPRRGVMDPPLDADLPAPSEMPSPGRMEAFSDGVFSIIITLLVLDLRVPRLVALHGGSLGAALLDQWPAYVAFVLSFLQVGVVWANHHTMFHYIHRTDHKLLVYNLLLLLAVAVLPFTTAVLSEYIRGDEAQARLAAQIYSGALMLVGVTINLIWQHALNARLVHPRADPHRLYALRRHWLLVPVLYAAAFALAFVDVSVSVAMYVVLLFYYALPGPIVLRWVAAGQARKALAG
jgi:uncharacterized membrane protein